MIFLRETWKCILLIIVFSLAFSCYAFSNRKWTTDYTFIAGEYGSKCYVEGNENENIVYKVYFDTLDECKNFINRNN